MLGWRVEMVGLTPSEAAPLLVVKAMPVRVAETEFLLAAELVAELAGETVVLASPMAVEEQEVLLQLSTGKQEVITQTLMVAVAVAVATTL